MPVNNFQSFWRVWKKNATAWPISFYGLGQFSFQYQEKLEELQMCPLPIGKKSTTFLAIVTNSLIINIQDRIHLKLSNQSNWAWSQSTKSLTFLISMAPLRFELRHHFHYRLLLLSAYCLCAFHSQQDESGPAKFPPKMQITTCHLWMSFLFHFQLRKVTNFVLTEIITENCINGNKGNQENSLVCI